MPTALIDGIDTHYELVGSGPPLLMFSPGGFNARLANWREQGKYREIRPVEHLETHYTCITFDRREAGSSGGRVERITWAHYVAQAKGLIDHLGYKQVHVMGGCQGCSVATAFAVTHPDVALSLVLYWPAGGAKYRIAQHARFAQHLAYVQQEGLDAVVALAKNSDQHFGQDPRIGPWGAVIRADERFAETYAKQDSNAYRVLVNGMARTLLDRDTMPGPEPEDLMRLKTPTLIIPGQDDSHATSAARYLEECLANAEYWDVPVPDQTAQTVAARIHKFLDSVAAPK
ncbi:MAG TPA: alpha/beta hydrolase [Jiangellaceae bacterium]